MTDYKMPEIGKFQRNHGTLIKIEDVTLQPRKELDYIFESVAARVEIRLNGKLVKTCGTYGDIDGFCSSIPNAIEEAKRLKITYGETDAEFVVVKIVTQRRCRPSNHENFYEKGYRDFAAKEYGSGVDLPEDKEEVVWSSKEETQSLPTNKGE